MNFHQDSYDISQINRASEGINIAEVSMKENEERQHEYEDEMEGNNISPVHPRMETLRKLYLLMFINQFLVISLASSLAYTMDITIFKNIWTFRVCLLVLIGTFTLIYTKRRYLMSPLRNFLIMMLVNIKMIIFLTTLLEWDSSKVILLIFVGCDSVVLFLVIYAFISQSIFTFEVASLTILAPIFFVFNIFLLFSRMSLETLIFGTVLAIIWGFFVIYETQSIMKFSRTGIEKKFIFIESITIYVDLFLLVLRSSELLFEVIITKRSRKLDKPIISFG